MEEKHSKTEQRSYREVFVLGDKVLLDYSKAWDAVRASLIPAKRENNHVNNCTDEYLVPAGHHARSSVSEDAATNLLTRLKGKTIGCKQCNTSRMLEDSNAANKSS